MLLFRGRSFFPVLMHSAILASSLSSDAIAQEPKPIGAVLLVGPKLKDWEPALKDYVEKNNLPLVVTHNREKTRGDFDQMRAKARVEVGAIRTLKDWRYALELGVPFQAPQGVDYYYPYILYFNDPVKMKPVEILRNATLFAHWREPLPQQLPRLMSGINLSDIREIVAPQLLTGDGVTGFREPIKAYRGPPIKTYYPVQAGKAGNKNTAEVLIHNRLPFAVSIKIGFRRTFIGDAWQTFPEEFKPGEKRTISVGNDNLDIRSASLDEFYILDPEIQPLR